MGWWGRGTELDEGEREREGGESVEESEGDKESPLACLPAHLSDYNLYLSIHLSAISTIWYTWKYPYLLVFT